ncbi:hypothetical protein NG799_22840 [Laspinema sp. D1]|uniref:Uncharacterized protein n=1 Tax=Laspinema palackyanum D2a TaxID=2953684 RepID=A0ABT2N0A3_9CYAN|nr:hypothetical protein [Laspinema sp. D2a]
MGFFLGDRHVTHFHEAIAPVWSRVPTSFFVTGISPRQEDPTLTRTLARGGDRRTPP